MSDPSSRVIFANESEVAAVATRFFGFLEYHVKRHCRCRSEEACRRYMRDVLRTALKAMKWEP